MSRRSPRRRSRHHRTPALPAARVPELTSTEDAYRKLLATALADAEFDLLKTVNDYNALRVSLPNLRRVIAWLYGRECDKAANGPEGITFAEACLAFNRDPQAVANHMMRQLPEPLYWLARHGDSPFGINLLTHKE